MEIEPLRSIRCCMESTRNFLRIAKKEVMSLSSGARDPHLSITRIVSLNVNVVTRSEAILPSTPSVFWLRSLRT